MKPIQSRTACDGVKPQFRAMVHEILAQTGSDDRKWRFQGALLMGPAVGDARESDHITFALPPWEVFEEGACLWIRTACIFLRGNFWTLGVLIREASWKISVSFLSSLNVHQSELKRYQFPLLGSDFLFEECNWSLLMFEQVLDVMWHWPKNLSSHDVLRGFYALCFCYFILEGSCMHYFVFPSF